MAEDKKLTREEAIRKCRFALWVATEDEAEVNAILSALREPEALSVSNKQAFLDRLNASFRAQPFAAEVGWDDIEEAMGDDFVIVRVKP